MLRRAHRPPARRAPPPRPRVFGEPRSYPADGQGLVLPQQTGRGVDAVDTITTGHTLECHAAKIVDPQARLESLHQRGDKGFSARPT